MDYKKIMMEANFDYYNFYETRMQEIENELNVTDSVKKLLKDKRKFGHDKYGESSFQGSFKNSITAPSEMHLEEELLDALNYAVHNALKCHLVNDPERKAQYFIIGEKIFKLLLETMDLNEQAE